MRRVLLIALFFISIPLSFSQFVISSDTTICGPGTVSLEVLTSPSYGTSAYEFNVIPYAPETHTGTTVNLTDDSYGGPFPIGFDFCFMDGTYNQFYIGSNGWISFGPLAALTTTYTSEVIPSAAGTVPKNCIMGPWQDWHPGLCTGCIKYKTYGTAPNRRLVVSWSNVPMFSCTTTLGSFQIVIYETSNNIKNHLINKPNCLAWAGGTATEGTHNLAGTLASVYPGRNSTAWTSSNESVQFSPTGVVWTTGATVVGVGDSISVTPAATTTYTATLTDCDGLVWTEDVTVTLNNDLSVFSYSGSPFCLTDPDPAPILVTGGISGTWTATPAGIVINSVTGVIDLSASTPGNYTITNTIPATGGCPATSSSFPIEISTGPVVTIDPSAITICDGGSVILTADATPSTGDCAAASFINTTDYTIFDHPGPITYSPITVSGIIPTTLTSTMIDKVCINILHTWDDDLDISLISPAGTAMKLSFDNGGAGDNYTNTCFVVSGAPAITTGSAPFTGNYLPQQPFSLLDGGPVNGLWQLKVDDDLGGFAGTLLDWSISFLCTNTIDSYVWIPATGLSSTIDSAVTATPTTTTTYTVTVTETAGCSTSATSTVTVVPPATATFTYPGTPYCQDLADPLPVLGAGATSGTWSATPAGLSINTTTGLIDLSASTPGSYTITNLITGAASCPDVSATYPVTILALDDPAFSYSSSTFCVTGSDPAPVITGLSGGVFSGAGVVFVSTSTGVIDLDATGIGTYTVAYTTAGSCPQTATQTITISNAPSATFTYTGSPFCSNETNPLPVFGVGASSGVFSASPAGLTINAASGEIDLDASLPGTYTVTNAIAASGGCSASSATYSITIYTAYDNTTSVSICTGDSYTLPGGSVVTTAGTYIDAFTTINGCDSILTTILTTDPVYIVTVDVAICDGDGYSLPDGSVIYAAGSYPVVLTTSSGCDSTIITNVIVLPVNTSYVASEICDDEFYVLPDGGVVNISGVYSSIITSASGCDSIIETTLSVNPTYYFTENITLCYGDTYILPDGTNVFIDGTYFSFLSSASGCDSVIESNVVFNPIYAIVINDSICAGETYVLPDGTTVSTGGTYTNTLSTTDGCDSVVITNLIVNPIYSSTVSATICSGDTYILPDGSSATTAGTYITTLTSTAGCDSIITTNLTVNPIFSSTVSAAICSGDIYALPDGTTATTTGTYVTTLASISGCDSVITTNLTVNPIYSSTVSATICSGDIYTLPDGNTATTTGTYITTLSSIAGCDSVITTNLTVNPIYISSTSATICSGDIYTLPDGSTATTAGTYTTTLFSISGCDSVITTNLTVNPIYSSSTSATICSGDIYVLPDGSIATATGTYVTTLSSIAGCDSVITTNLIVNPTYAVIVDAEICDGATYILPDGSSATAAGTYVTTLISTAGCDSIITTNLIVNPTYAVIVDVEICDGATYILPDGSSATTAGTYITTLTSTAGCDSIITTNLIVNPTYTTTVDAEICDGATYILPDGSSATTSGTYTTTLTSAAGCDSVITTNLTVNPIYSSSTSATICSGDIYTLPDGSTVTTTGTYISTLSSISGCDSVITTNLTVNPIYSSSTSASICSGDTYILPDGSTATTTGTYISTLSSISGCDSIITTNLTVNPIYSSTISATICSGDIYTLPDGSTATITGTYISTLFSISGCDSIITTNLTVNPIYSSSTIATICSGDIYILPDGSTATTTGTYITTLGSISGCDSIITTNLTVNPIYSTSTSAAICSGDIYTLPDGSIATTTGTYITTLGSISGCDSVITTNLIVNPTYTTTVDAEICDGATYILPDGSSATTSGTYTTTLTSAAGCDSVITTNLIVNPTYTATFDAEICDGATYILPDGSSATTSGTYTTTLTSAAGCDSVITTNLIVNPTFAVTVDAEICDGATYILPDGSTATTAGTYTTTLISIAGCDSIITTNLTVNPTFAVTVDAEICNGATYVLPDGTTATTTGTYISTLTSTGGCDSVITTILIVNPTYASTIDAEICDGATYTLPDGSSATSAGTYITTLTSAAGCDSIITTNISIITVYTTTVDAEICDGATYILPDGSTTTTAGTYTTTLISTAGCDSIITTNITIITVYTTTVDAEICDGATYILPDGSSASAAGTYVTTLTSTAGCDSIITTNISIITVYTITVDAEICDGATYVLPDGSTATAAGTYTTTLISTAGCDSIITTNISLITVYATTVDAEICDGATYILPDGSSATTSGTYTTTLISTAGCDSIITTNISFITVYTTTVDAEICDGATYILPDGSSATTSGTYTTTLTSIAGCDSIITTNISIITVYTTTVDAEICDGATYILPDGSSATTAGTYITTLTSTAGCDSIITTNLIVNPTFAVTVDAEICDGATYILPDGSIATTTGTYITALSSISGCDSVITTNLIVNPTFAVTVDVEICDGATYILPDGSSATTAGTYINTLTSTAGCDSIITTNISIITVYTITVDAEICDGATYVLPDGSTATAAGTYTTTLISTAGCDSIITTNISLITVYATTVDAEICDGATYILPDGSSATSAGTYVTTLSSIYGCDSIITTNISIITVYTTTVDSEICDGVTYILPDGSSVATAGTYITTLTSTAGCDSIITTNLTVNPTFAVTVDAEICDGATYILPDGSSTTSAGTYTTTLISTAGCDSIITTNISFITVYTTTVDAEICDGATYILPDGSSATTPGTYISTLTSTAGCDSVITTNLIVNPTYAVTVDAEICDGATYILPDGSSATTPGTYISTLTSTAGCDSVITTNLIVNPTYAVTVDAEICDGATYILPDGSSATTAGTYVTTLGSIYGCDSIITTNISIITVYTTTVDAEICDGATYILPDGSSATTAGTYVTTLASTAGCDSVITTNLIINPTYASTIDAEICDGATYILPDGSSATAAGTYVTTLASTAGCDSVITTNLIVNPTFAVTVDAEICDGATYLLPDGSSATTAGTYVTTLISTAGCDSIVTTNISIITVYTTTVDAEICDGATYILPDGSSATTAGTYVTTLTSIAGCDSIITTNISIITVYTTTVDAEICDGATYILPDGSSATTAGTYTTTFISTAGCDSVITTNLIVNPTFAITVDAEICDGVTYILPDGSSATTAGTYLTTLTSITGCDSIITTNIFIITVYTTTVDAEICDGATYVLPDGIAATTSGTYTTILTSTAGCDSVITTNLTVNPTYTATFDAEICDGATYILPDGSSTTSAGTYTTTLISTAGCDSVITTNLIVNPVYAVTVDAEICDGATYLLPDGSSTTTSGTYTTTLTSTAGCDSVITTNLIVNPTYASTVDVEICDGATYILPDGSSATTAGTYITTLASTAGCDSIITTNLNVNPTYAVTVDAEICDGATYILPDGIAATTSGTYTTILTSTAGCDSVITTNLIVNPTFAVTVDAEICDGATYILPDGSSATTSGTYTTTLISTAGCDSVITTNLIVNPTYAVIVDAEICDGATYILPDGSSVATAGTYTTTLTSTAGCDSVITTNLIVNPTFAVTVDAEICDGATYILPDGSSVATAGTYTTTLTSTAGCDSIITTNLIVNPTYAVTVDAEICDGATYILPDGSSATTAGTYINTLTSTAGCDSIIITNLIVNPTYAVTVDAEICDGATYILPDGSSVATAGTYTTTLTSTAGCDSIITTNLIVNPTYAVTVDAEICDGATYILPDGSSATTAGTYINTLTSTAGCDSIIITNLIVNPTYAVTVDAEICDGATYILPDGIAATTSGTYTTILTSIAGCDSVITTILIVNPTFAVTVDAEICDGATYVLPDGTTATTTGTYISTLASTAGCDSIITTNLIVNPTYAVTVDAEICDGATYILPDGIAATTSGTYTTTLTSAAGCDSVITTNLIVNPVYAVTVDAEICDGATYILPDGSLVSTTGTYVTTLTSIYGCDSIISTNLFVKSPDSLEVTVEICDGEEYLLPDGILVSTSGDYISIITPVYGCDSIITTHLFVMPVYDINVDVEICDGDMYTLPDGTIVSVAGTYTSSLTTYSACDSIITTYLTVHPQFTGSEDITICSDATYILPDGTEVSAAGTFTSNLTTVYGCDSVITTNLSVIPVITTEIDASICSGETYTLPDGTIATVSGTYNTILISASGCDSIIETTLNIIPGSDTLISANICSGESYMLPDGTETSASGIYDFSFVSATGCDSLITINLTVVPLPVLNISGLDAAYCINAEPITVSVSPAGGILSGDGITGTEFYPSMAGAGGPYIISYAYTDFAGCSDTISVNVSVNPLPVIALDIPPQMCVEADPIAVAFSPAGGELSGAGISGLYFTPSLAGTGGPYAISYTYTDVNGCTAQLESFVTVTENVVDAGLDQSIIVGDSVYLDAATSGSVIWSPAIGIGCYDCSGTFAAPLQTTTYIVTATDINGCIATDDVTVFVSFNPDETIFAPSAFTPNGDGKNDFFFVYGPDIDYVESLMIYDRWGELLFEAKQIPAGIENEGWDGTFLGSELNPGVYVWVAEIMLKGNVQIRKYGNVTLLK